MTQVRLPIVLAMALLVLGAAQASVSLEPRVEAATTPELVVSILIDGDAALAGSAAVRSGSGTSSDPYVISNYFVLRTHAYGIYLKDTRAHVLIEDVTVEGLGGAPWRDVSCEIEAQVDCTNVGIALLRAENVTIRRARIYAEELGIGGGATRNLRIEDTRISALGREMSVGGGFRAGIFLGGAKGTVIRNVTVANATHALDLVRPRGLSLVESTFHGQDGTDLSIQGPGSDIQIARSLFHSMGIRVTLPDIERLDIIGNRFEGGYQAVSISDARARVRDLTICGNTMRDQTSIFGAIEVLGVDSASVRGNLIENAVWGMTLIGQDMLVTGNHIHNSTFKALDLEGVDTVVRNNSFQGSGEDAWIGGEVDARENWWGSAKGPSINGSSGGEALTITFGNVTYSPWLQVPPARDSSCTPSEAGAGVGAPASMRGQAMVGAAVHMDEELGNVHVKANEEREHALDTGEVPLG